MRLAMAPDRYVVSRAAVVTLICAVRAMGALG